MVLSKRMSQRVVIHGCIVFTLLSLAACGNKPNEPVQTKVQTEPQSQTNANSEIQISFGETPTKAMPLAMSNSSESKFVTFKGQEFRKVDAESQKPPETFGIFTKKGFIREWIDLGSSKKIHTIDLILAIPEGNAVFEDRFNLSENYNAHLDPGSSKRVAKPGNIEFGKVNAGFYSVNCFEDRPNDSELRKVCADAFAKAGKTLAQVESMTLEQIRDLYYDTNLPYDIGVSYSVGLRKNADQVVSMVGKYGIVDPSTSLYLYFIDQSNQLGLGGVSELIQIYANIDNIIRLYDVMGSKIVNYPELKDQLCLISTNCDIKFTKEKESTSYPKGVLSKVDYIDVLQKLGIVGNDKIFYTGFGDPIDLTKLETEQIRSALARVFYHNSGTSTKFTTKQTWLTRAANKWTFNSLKKDNPTIQKDLEAEILKINPNANLKALVFRGEQAGDQIKVTVLDGDKVTITKNYPYNGKNRDYTNAQVAFADPLRRIYKLPQSQQQLEAMIKDTPDFVNNRFPKLTGAK